MNAPSHPTAERLLQFADGAELAADERQHLDQCDACQQQLAELAAFEAAVADHLPMPPAARRRAQRATAALLGRGALPRAHRRLVAAGAWAAAAASLLAALLLWSRGPSLPTIVCDRPDPTRAAAFARFHVDCVLAAGSWPLLWSEGDDGSLQPLLPNADPLLAYLGAEPPLAKGPHRLPASALFDFEFEPARPPRLLRLVVADRATSAAERSTLQQQLTECAPAARQAWLQQRFPTAWELPFPDR